MERRKGMKEGCTAFQGASWRGSTGRVFIPVLVLATVLLSFAGPAGAAHLTYATNCTECHSVANAEAEAGPRPYPIVVAPMLNGGRIENRWQPMSAAT